MHTRQSREQNVANALYAVARACVVAVRVISFPRREMF